MGHVRDLPANGLNVDIENDFAPTYQITPGRKKTVTTLKAAAKNMRQTLYLATDLDREGEAIAWHLSQLLGMPEEKTFRVIFNAITESAIKKAFARARQNRYGQGPRSAGKTHPRQARRLSDKPSALEKIARGLSAGRVQSVTVKMIVERERQIRNFKPVEYWLIPAIFTTEP